MTTLTAGEPVTVRLIKLGKTDVNYPGVVIADDGDRVVIRAPWALDVRDCGFVTFQPGDVFTEHFWRTRWYAVKQVRSAEGRLKGWYCDVTMPAVVTPGEIVSADLVLDLWCGADGTVLRLDEDEFNASGVTDTDPATAAAARRALDELETLARAGFAELE